MPFCKIIFVVLFLVSIKAAAQQPRLVLPVGHAAGITSTEFSPDGTKILTASEDATAKIWDVNTGILLSDLKGHSNIINYACFSADGKKVVTSSDDSSVIIWDIFSGKALVKFKEEFSIKSAVFSPDGKKILTIGEHGFLKIWDSFSGKLIMAKIHGLTVTLTTGRFSPDGQKIVTAGYDDKAKLWDLSSGKLVADLKGHKSYITSVVFSNDGAKLLTASDDSTAKIWNSNTGELLATLNHSQQLTSAEFSSTDEKIVTSSYDSTAKIWDARSGKLLVDLKGHSAQVWSASFSPDGSKIVTASGDGTSKVWNASTGEMIGNIESNAKYVSLAKFSPNGKKILTVLSDETAKIWNASSYTFLRNIQLQKTEYLWSVSYIEDGKKIMASSSHAFSLWDAFSGQVLPKRVLGNVKSNRPKLLIDGTKVKILDGSGRLTSVLVDTQRLLSAEFSPTGNEIVTISEDKAAKIWNTASGSMLMALKINKDQELSGLKFSPDGKMISVVYRESYIDGDAIDYNEELRIWDIDSGKMLWNLIGSHSINSIQWGFDGKKILFAVDGIAQIWNSLTGKSMIVFNDIPRRANFEWSGGEKELRSFEMNGEAKEWDANTGLLLKKIGIIRLETDAYFSGIDWINERVLSRRNSEIIVQDLKNGKKIVTFLNIDSTNYFTQLPSGYYLSTPGAAKLLHYVTPDLKVITFDQLDVKYNRPDKVLEALGNTDTSLIKSYRKAWEKRIKKLGIDTTAFRDGYSVPEADFVNREEISYEQTNETLKLHVKGIDSAYKLDRFNIWVNEAPLFGQRGVSIKKKNSNSVDTTITIKLSQGENRIEISISNVNGTESYRMPLQVNYTPAIKQKEMTRFIGIGIDRFADSQYNLQYSVKDIRDLADSLRRKFKDNIIIDTLFNANVTVSNVKALKQKLLQTTENDKVIIAYSGHGMLSKDYDYFLSTYAVNFEKPEQNGLAYDELENLLDSIPARKKLMLIDACHSGEVDKEEMVTINKKADSLGLKGAKGVIVTNTGQAHLGLNNSFELMQNLFVNVGKSTGATVISAAGGMQFALERNDLKNGVFTFSILEAMNKYPAMKLSELKKIVGERVEELTKGLQKPTSRNEAIAVDWNVW